MKFFTALSIFLSFTGVCLAQPLEIYTEISPPSQVEGPGGRPMGPAVETVREIQRRLGQDDPIQIVPWTRGYLLARNHPDTVLFLMTRDKERNGLFQWVGPVREGTYGLYVRADSPIVLNSLDDAKKLGSIGVYQGDVRAQILGGLGFTNLDKAMASVNNVEKLMRNRIEAFASADVAVESLVKAAGYDPGLVKKALTFYKYQSWIAFSRDTPAAVVRAWAGAFEAMKADGTFARIWKKDLPGWVAPGPPLVTF